MSKDSSSDDFEYNAFFSELFRDEVLHCQDIVDLATAIHYLRSNGFSYETIIDEIEGHTALYSEAVENGKIMACMAKGMRDGIHHESMDWKNRTDSTPIKTDREYCKAS